MGKEQGIHRSMYLGLFFLSLATLTYEILLTRIFSVTLMYHFAFMAVSIAMFGMTVGAVIVFLKRKHYSNEHIRPQLALNALWFAITIVISFVIHLYIPLRDGSLLLPLLTNYIVISIPFVFSGICISLALTSFPKHVDRLYASDLVGAAFGCFALIIILKYTDGLTAMLFTAFFASIGAYLFAVRIQEPRIPLMTLAVTLSFAAISIIHAILVQQQIPLLKLRWVKGEREPALKIEKWNTFSRVRVFDNPKYSKKPFGYGLSTAYTHDTGTNQLYMDIDASAATILTEFNGNLDKVDYLKYDVSNVVHYLRPDSNVLIIGVGGGRDVLSAMVFGQKSVTGVEINENIIDIVTKTFGDYTGHLDKYTNINFITDEARSYITRSNDIYDIIQVTLIDTWAATSAGAFVLSENSLYTVEAWQIFLEHLSSNGIISFSRWYFRDQPGEMYRLTALAGTALKQYGITKPREHMLIVRYLPPLGGGDLPDGIGTLLLSKTPFSKADLIEFQELIDELEFEIVLSPYQSLDPNFAGIIANLNSQTFFSEFPINISPPTDDSPYFFHMLRLRDMAKQELWDQGLMSFNMIAVYTLGALLLIVALLTLLCIIVPLLLASKKADFKGSAPFFLYFFSIGIGFMLIEISQMQRLTVFLGHPSYSLSVVLFSLLSSSGLGSYLTKNVSSNFLYRPTIRLILLIGILAIFGFLTPWLISQHSGSSTIFRILITIGILFPVGLFLGMAFPMGMKMASNHLPSLTPWLWGINGAASVFSTVLATAIALSYSISASFWSGLICYVFALVAYAWGSLRYSNNKNGGLFVQPT